MRSGGKTCGWPDRRIGKDAAHLEQAVAFIRRHRPRAIAVPYWSDRHPDHVAASALLTEGVFNSGLRRYQADGEAWKAEWICYYFINDSAPPSFVVDVSDYYQQKRAALDCHTSQFQRSAPGAAATRLNTPLFRQLDRKPRRAVRRPRRRDVGGGVRRSRAADAGQPDESRPMNIGIVCYASIGGSGVIATELGKTLASRGHGVHILSSDTPFRLGDYQPGLSFHRVETPAYPLFREPQYLLSLANKIVQVARAERLDIIHAHYAIPHATAAYLARQILAAPPLRRPPPKVITTLHGTDITLLGSDPSYSETVAFCIQQSDGVTAVSESLKADTQRELGVDREIRVIPNFLDCSVHRRIAVPDLRNRFARPDEKIVIHVSNFRPVKRVAAAVEVFGRIRSEIPCPAADGGRRTGHGRSGAADAGAGAHRATCTSSGSRTRCCRCFPFRTCSCCRPRRRASAWRRSRPWPARCR